MTPPATNNTRRKGTVRCAIYTRKSSEEGLDQEFNSLQAQREACEAFITSQRHEGWVCLSKSYKQLGHFGGGQQGFGFGAAVVRGLGAQTLDSRLEPVEGGEVRV
jgi:site-specific DNA recombinase